MRLGVHVGIVALPAATLGTKGIALPGTPASTATTTTMPTTAILCTTLLDPPIFILLSKLDSKVQLLGRRIICAIADLEPGFTHVVAFVISVLSELEMCVGKLQHCITHPQGRTQAWALETASFSFSSSIRVAPGPFDAST